MDGSAVELDFVNIAVLSETPGLLPPQFREFNVSGVTIPPPFTATTDITLITEQNFTVITTIGAEVDGVGCFDVSESSISCSATVEPTIEDNRRRRDGNFTESITFP